MRIALITPGFSANEEDWCIPVLLDMVRHLGETHDLHVFALTYPHQDREYRVYNAKVTAFGARAGRRGGSWRSGWCAYRAILKHHRSQPFEVVHAFWGGIPGLVATACGQSCGVPTLLSLMGGEAVHLPAVGYGAAKRWLNRALVSRSVALADRVTAGSHFMAEIAQSAFRRSIDLWPLGVETGRFHPQESRQVPISGSPCLLSVASLVPVKGHETVLEAISGLLLGPRASSFSNLQYHIVGSGPLESALHERASRLGIADHVIIHGPVPHHDLPAFYRAADLLIVGSHFESQCMAALEAVACGTPVIGTATGILPDLADKSMTVPPADGSLLANAIGIALNRPGWLSDEAARQRSWVEQGHTLEKSLEALAAIYDALLEPKRGNGKAHDADQD